MARYQKMYSTQTVLYPFLALAQCFGLFPITGIRGNDFRTIRFSWQSKQIMCTLPYLIFGFINFCFYFIKQLNSTEFLTPFVGLIYFATTLLTEIFFVGLARQWPYLMEKWAELDLLMTSYSHSNGLSRKLKVTSIFVLAAAFGEHGLFIANGIAIIESNITRSDIIDIYFKTNYDQVFDIIPYNICLGIFMEVFNICCAFAWNYKDLFIMLISMTLSERYWQISNKIRLMSKYKVTGQSHWRSVRENYVKLTALCKIVSQLMTNIIVLSFMHNLFVVLIQFMYTIRPSNYMIIGRFYFIYSFGFLIIRIICVCLFAAEIDQESRKPLEILTCLSSKIYNIEIERLIIQITVGPAYLSGGDFFSITRSLVLRMSAAIVTYELVLIQIYNYG